MSPACTARDAERDMHTHISRRVASSTPQQFNHVATSFAPDTRRRLSLWAENMFCPSATVSSADWLVQHLLLIIAHVNEPRDLPLLSTLSNSSSTTSFCGQGRCSLLPPFVLQHDRRQAKRVTLSWVLRHAKLQPDHSLSPAMTSHDLIDCHYVRTVDEHSKGWNRER
jgi:hypothetical protein